YVSTVCSAPSYSSQLLDLPIPLLLILLRALSTLFPYTTLFRSSADLDAHRQTFRRRQHGGTEAAAARQLLVELPQPRAVFIAAWQVDLTEAEGVVGEDHSALPQVFGSPGQIGGVAHLVGVDEKEVERRRRLHFGEHLQRGTDVDVRPRADTGLVERVRGDPRVLLRILEGVQHAVHA